jgi:hypothetical protein
VGALVFADLAQEPVRLGVARRRPVDAGDLAVLGPFAGRKHPVDGSNTGLEPLPGRELDGGRVGNLHAQLGQAGFDALPVAALGVRHLAQDVGAAVVLLARGEELIEGARLDLAAPGGQQPVDGLGRRRRGLDHVTAGAQPRL